MTDTVKITATFAEGVTEYFSSRLAVQGLRDKNMQRPTSLVVEFLGHRENYLASHIKEYIFNGCVPALKPLSGQGYLERITVKPEWARKIIEE